MSVAGAVALHSDPEVIAAIEAALIEHGGDTHGLTDVLIAAQSGDAQVWRDGKTVVVTEILEYPKSGRHLNIWVAAGEFDKIHALVEECIEWAKGQGCKRVEISGRRGWERKLAPFGFKFQYVTLTKDI